tara:strand:- start:1092 stop:1295 length:204 start_codon:yes stop_codon:yes gene_type:complete
MQQGDLVYIPQGVEMWKSTENGMKMLVTDKPITGLYLSGESQIYQVYVDGDWSVQRKHVYPMENPSC